MLAASLRREHRRLVFARTLVFPAAGAALIHGYDRGAAGEMLLGLFLAVLFAVLAGGQLFGFMGVLLALPAAAVINVFLGYCKQHYLQSDVYADDDPAPPEDPENEAAPELPPPENPEP